MTWEQAVDVVIRISGSIIEDAKAGRPFIYAPELRPDDREGLMSAASQTAHRIIEAWEQPLPEGVAFDDLQGLCYMLGALWQYYSLPKERARQMIRVAEPKN